MMVVVAGVQQGGGLAGHRRDQGRMGMTEAAYRHAGETIKIGFASLVEQPAALPTHEADILATVVLDEVGVGGDGLGHGGADDADLHTFATGGWGAAMAAFCCSCFSRDYISCVPAAASPMRWTVWFWPALLATLVADLASKSFVFAQSRGSLPSWMERHYNTGVAWSLFADHPGFVAALTAALIPLLAWVWWSGYRKLGWSENLAFGLILGGALGNGYDRALAIFGHWPGVRDFIHVDLNLIGIPYIWPTFNLADSGITIGFVLLLVRAFAPGPKPTPAPTVS